MKISKLSASELVQAVLKAAQYSNNKLDGSLPAVKRIKISFNKKFLKKDTENKSFCELSKDYGIFINTTNNRLVVELIYKNKEN